MSQQPTSEPTETTDRPETLKDMGQPFRVTSDRTPEQKSLWRKVAARFSSPNPTNPEGSTVNDDSDHTNRPATTGTDTTDDSGPMRSERFRASAQNRRDRRDAWLVEERQRYANLGDAIKRRSVQFLRWIYYGVWKMLQSMSAVLARSPQPHRLAEDELRFNKMLGLLFQLLDVHPNLEVAPFNGKSGSKSTVASILIMFITKWTHRLTAYWVANPGVAADSEQYVGVYNRHERSKRKWLDKLSAKMLARGIGIPTGDTRDIAELFFRQPDGSFNWTKPNDVNIDDFQSVAAPNYVGTMVIAATSRVTNRFGYYANAMHALFRSIKRFAGILVVDTGNNPIDAWTGALLDEIGQVLFVAEAPSSDRGASSLTDARTTMAQMRENLTDTPGNLEKLQDAILVISGMQRGDDLDEIMADYFPDLDELDLETIEVMTIPYSNNIRKKRFYDIELLEFPISEAYLDLGIRLLQKAIIRRDGKLPEHLTLEHALAA